MQNLLFYIQVQYSYDVVSIVSVVFERKILKKMQYWKDELSDDYALLVDGIDG